MIRIRLVRILISTVFDQRDGENEKDHGKVDERHVSSSNSDQKNVITVCPRVVALGHHFQIGERQYDQSLEGT